MPGQKKNKKMKDKETSVTVKDIFKIVQEAPEYQEDKNVRTLHKVMKESDEQAFTKDFIDCLIRSLYGSYNNPYVKTLVKFISSFISSKLKQECDEEQDTSYFTTHVFEKIILLLSLDDKNFRFNSCSLLSQMLEILATNEVAFDDNICNKIIHVMIGERICDKVVPIREEAVKVLKWLKDESDPNCNITKTLLFHLSRDPSFEVRRLILNSLRLSATTLTSIVKRLRDTKESIRIDAFTMLGSRRKMTSLSYATRECIIMTGLRDESEAVRRTVEDKLLPTWLEQLDGDILRFVTELDAETHSFIPKKVLPIFFKNAKIKDLIAAIKPPENEKFLPIETLTPSNALYWSSLAKYLADLSENAELTCDREEATDALDKIIPSVVELCNYISIVYDSPLEAFTSLGDEGVESKRISILVSLFELFEACNLSDVGGRRACNNLLERILKSPDCLNKFLIECVTRVLALGYVDPVERVNVILSLIEDIHSPLISSQVEEEEEVQLTEDQIRSHRVQMTEVKVKMLNLQAEMEDAVEKQDYLEAERLKGEIKEQKEIFDSMDNVINKKPKENVEMVREEIWTDQIVLKCLIIILEMMRNEDIFKVSIGLTELVQGFIKQCIAIDHPVIMALAVEITGIFCLQRLVNASKLYPMFYVLLNNELRPFDEVRAICVKCICAIILRHGRKNLNIPDDEPVFAPERNRFNTSIKPELSFISNITYLLDDPVESVRTEAVIGLSKLVLAGQIASPPLLSRLILLWYNPANQSNKILMKMLGQFFSIFPIHHKEAPQQLIAVLLPTLDVLFEAPHTSPLIEIDPKNLGLFIVDLARPGRNKYSEENAHDKMAILLLQRVLEDSEDNSIQLLLRLCANLSISMEDEDSRRKILYLAKKIRRENRDLKSNDLTKIIESLRLPEDSSSQSSASFMIDSQESNQNELLPPVIEEEIEMSITDNTLTSTTAPTLRRGIRRTRSPNTDSE